MLRLATVAALLSIGSMGPGLTPDEEAIPGCVGCPAYLLADPDGIGGVTVSIDYLSSYSGTCRIVSDLCFVDDECDNHGTITVTPGMVFRICSISR